MPGRQLHQLAMRLGLRADLDEVEGLLPVEEIGRVGVHPASGTIAAACSTRCGIHVADRDQMRVGHARPGLQVELGDIPAADQGPPQGRCGTSHGECLVESRSTRSMGA